MGANSPCLEGPGEQVALQLPAGGLGDLRHRNDGRDLDPGLLGDRPADVPGLGDEALELAPVQDEQSQALAPCSSARRTPAAATRLASTSATCCATRSKSCG